MQNGGWQQQPPDPWGGPPRLALSGDAAAAEAWPELPGLPPISTGATEPKLGPRILIPGAAALLVAAGMSVVPWHADGSPYPSVVWFFADHGPRDFGDLYALYFAGPLGLLAVLAGFAGATDLRPLRWLQLGAAVVLLGGVTLLGLANPATPPVPLVGLAVLGLLAAAVLAFLKRVALRLAAAGCLVGCALLHAGTLALWDAPWLAPTGYLPSLGYLVAACGAAIGPRYVPVYRPL